MTTRNFVITMALGLVFGLAAPAYADFNFTTIDVPGSTRTSANGNSTHAIAGDFDDEDGNTHGFVLSNGQFTTIDVPGADLTSLNGVAANGRLTGTYLMGRFYAFFWNNGAFTTLDPPGAIRSAAGFLNAQGKVVGTYRDGGEMRVRERSVPAISPACAPPPRAHATAPTLLSSSLGSSIGNQSMRRPRSADKPAVY